MVEFKKSFESVLPYDRRQYIDFFGETSESSVKWFGVSFQLPGVSEGEKIEVNKFVEIYEPLFYNVVSKLDNGTLWIVNHDDKDLKWFPNNHQNLTGLRKLFRENEISNNFIGALILTKHDLFRYSKDLLLYPYVVLQKDGYLYKNLDISHSELKFVIEISGHQTIDFRSTDEKLLQKVIDEISSNSFIVKKYRVE